MNIYQEQGYKDRKDYLASLATEHGLSIALVLDLASLLGESEDFDGLVIACQDAEDMELDE